MAILSLASVTSVASVASAKDDSRDQPRLRVIIETDAGGDPDDEQSLVRFLLYCNEWDVEGIICARPKARNKENRNSARTGVGIVKRTVGAYGECFPHLIQHDARYPRPEVLLRRTVAGYEDCDEGVELIIAAVDSEDPRPLWFMNWGTDYGSAPSSLKRALDQVLDERGPAGYAAFKNRIRLSSCDRFGDHTAKIQPPFKIWVDPFYPNGPFPGVKEKRWYRRFGPLTETAGGFDLKRDVLTGHGPLGALYPTNTDVVQKEGDSMTFLYLVPIGMNNPEQPTWGSWGGRHGRDEKYQSQPYYWANQQDTWQGVTHRESTLKRWVVPIQNDFRSRMDWCVTDFQDANHPPVPRVKEVSVKGAHVVKGTWIQGMLRLTVAPGDTVALDASESTDSDGGNLNVEWVFYSEPSSYRGVLPKIQGATSSQVSFVAPLVRSAKTIHLLLMVTDEGTPPLTRYQRVIVTIDPRASPQFLPKN